MSSQIDLKNIELNYQIDCLQAYIKQINYGIFTKSYTRHCHGKNYFELHLVCGGCGKLITEEGKYELKKGMLYMTGPGVLHEQLTDPQDPMHEYCLGFELRIKKNEPCSPFGESLLETRFWIGEDTGECERLFMMISKESKSRIIGYSVNIQSAVSSILVELVRHYTGCRKGYEFEKIAPDDRRANIVDSYFIYQYANASEKSLGQLLGLSIRQVQRFLKTNYGKTFSEMKREAKLNKAYELIHNGTSIEEAAFLVGYNNTAFFRKLLKENLHL